MSERVAAQAHDDERRIREVVAQASRAQSDIEALLALHTPDAVAVNLPGRRVLGRAALAEAMAGALNSPLCRRAVRARLLSCRVGENAASTTLIPLRDAPRG